MHFIFCESGLKLTKSQGISLAFLMNLGKTFYKIARGKPCIFDESGLKLDNIASGKPCGIFYESGLKLDKIARGKPCVFDEFGLKFNKIARGKPGIFDEFFMNLG